MSRPLVIVESPAKAKTIAGILGRDYIVESSVGHIRDLPEAASEIPPAYKSEVWARRLGVDVDNDFKPLYVVSTRKKDQVKKLKRLMSDASELYLATDEDREGESIAWHLIEVLSPRIPVKRMVFHEITKEAIRRAVEHPRELDRRLVDSQEARRILDRLFGYELSPVLWKKVAPKLSAGRVQSVATRILVERERERMRFKAASFWGLEATLVPSGPSPSSPDPSGSFVSLLVSLDGNRVAVSRDFDESGQPRREVLVLDESAARRLAERLRSAAFQVSSVEEKPFTRSPYAPFITSTLQQEASRKLHFGSQRTMQVAQRLYENGYITYMRTDSVVLSQTAIDAARKQARELYGSDYVPAQPRRYRSKVRNAQEAHEAIRPAGATFRTPGEVWRELTADEARLYDLIWKRTVASQMKDAQGHNLNVRISAKTTTEQAEFVARGKTITFPGFLRAYVEGADDPEAELEDQEVVLPPLRQDQVLQPTDVEAKGHSTVPPSRYSEASLVKKLEELGVGRPSTYASTIATIQNRGYVWKKGNALVPSFLAFAVIRLLEEHFSKFVDYGFTADMEQDLDEIAEGDEETVPWLTRFYFGNGYPGLKRLVSDEHLHEIDPAAIGSLTLGKDAEGREIVVRVGRFGPYLQRGEATVSVPEDMAPDELTLERAEELLSAPSVDRELGRDPKSGRAVYLRTGRFGPYVQLGEADDDDGKPARASLFASMDPSSVTLEEAVRLLELPRVVGIDPSDGAEIAALNGRYGPFLKKGADTRTLSSEEQIFAITLDEALGLFSQPKTGRRRGGTTALREIGTDPDTGLPILLKEGRFGPYVTDGTTNASLPRGESVDSITLERSVELLAEKRAHPPKRKTTRRTSRGKKAKRS